MSPDSTSASPAAAELITIEEYGSVRGQDGVANPISAVCGYDGAGHELWRHETGASLLHIWSVADVNGDSLPEIVVGTYGYEHGISVGDIGDTAWAYVLCYSLSGELLWQQRCGRKTHLYSRALVADVDADSQPDVVVAWGSWDREFGRLSVLDGRTGAIKAQYPPSGPAPFAFTSLAAADINHDGRVEICASSSGNPGKVWVLRCNSRSPTHAADDASYAGSRDSEPESQLDVLAAHEFPAAIGEDFVNADLQALSDIDGDGQLELLVSLSAETQIDRDPYFYPSRVGKTRLVALAADAHLTQRAEIPLGSAVRAAIVSDLNDNGTDGVLVVTDRLEYYEPR